jgi:hypothetical protein
MNNPKLQQEKNIQRQIESRKMVGPEFCPKYGEVLVGYVPETRELVCNSCIFNKKLQNVRFISMVCKELKVEYNKAFN